jgi:hypothetical protein
VVSPIVSSVMQFGFFGASKRRSAFSFWLNQPKAESLRDCVLNSSG